MIRILAVIKIRVKVMADVTFENQTAQFVDKTCLTMRHQTQECEHSGPLVLYEALQVELLVNSMLRLDEHFLISSVSSTTATHQLDFEAVRRLNRPK